jgi:hypothetical protein
VAHKEPVVLVFRSPEEAKALHSFIAAELQQNAPQRAAAARALESMAREVQPRGGLMQSPELQHQCAERLFEEECAKMRVAQEKVRQRDYYVDLQHQLQSAPLPLDWEPGSPCTIVHG